jgi:hypothetical protein
MKHIYAIGLKGWTELRECDTKPKRYVTETVRPVKTLRYIPSNYDTGQMGYYKDIKRNMSIKAVVYLGGKVVKTLKTGTFAHLTQISIRNGGCMKLPADLVAALLEKKP